MQGGKIIRLASFEVGYLYLCVLGVAQRPNFPCLPARQES